MFDDAVLTFGLHIDALDGQRDRNGKRVNPPLHRLLADDDEPKRKVDNDAALRKLSMLPGVRMVE